MGMTLDSMKEWLDHWGDGPSWSDANGVTVPVVKTDLRKLIDDAVRMRDALCELKTRALNSAPGSTSEFAPATAASIAIICEDALDGTELKHHRAAGLLGEEERGIVARFLPVLRHITAPGDHEAQATIAVLERLINANAPPRGK